MSPANDRRDSHISIALTHDSMNSSHSNMSEDEKLNDHRHQSSSLPIRRESVNDNGGGANVGGAGGANGGIGTRALNFKQLNYETSNGGNNKSGRRNHLIVENSSGGSEDDVIDEDSDADTDSRSKSERGRAISFTDHIRSIVKPKDLSPNAKNSNGNSNNNNSNNNSSNINNNNNSNNNNNTSNGNNSNNNNINNNNNGILLNSDLSNKLSKQLSRGSNMNADSDADSHASRDSQETEEDVCFPMIPDHVRVKGIDFGEIEEFIQEQREENIVFKQREEYLKRNMVYDSGSSKSFSSTALKYTPKLKKPSIMSTTAADTGRKPGSVKSRQSSTISYSNKLNEKYGSILEDSAKIHDASSSSEEGVTFARNENMSIPPDRFSFFHSESDETIHAPDFPSLVDPGQSVKDLFIKDEGTWWLDCVCPTDAEMKMLAKAFGIHPLTAEDIRMQETREKVELFKSYYFVCFHTFETDNESEDFLEPINVYIVVFRDGVLTFHFSPISHPANVRRRVRQLRDYVNVSSDWLCYALIDDITDGFAPVIQSLEYEADAIEDSVFVARELDFGAMLRRIGESRRKVMTLMRLLSGKADVIKMFAKRCQDEAAASTGYYRPPSSNTNLQNLSQGANASPPHPNHAQPRADIALYLGDIQDHVLTMFQNLLSYEKIFSRSHSNYLAQLQVESFNANNTVTEMLSKVTVLGTILVPLNLITGLFGMNVHVPGQDVGTYGWFFGIVGVLIIFILVSLFAANRYLSSQSKLSNDLDGVTEGRSIRSFGFRKKNNSGASDSRSRKGGRSILSFTSKVNNRYD